MISCPLLGQRDDPRLVAAQGQPLEEQRVDLPLQFAGGPAGVDRLGLVERPGVGIIDAEQEPVMGPGQFVTQCVTNRVGQEERPHVAEVGLVETLAELRLETLGEPFQDPLAVAGPSLPRLLVLDDDAADFPGRSTMAVLTACQARSLAEARISRNGRRGASERSNSTAFGLLALAMTTGRAWAAGSQTSCFFFAMQNVYHGRDPQARDFP